MIFVQKDKPNKSTTKKSERCAQMYALLAFIFICLMGLMLYFAISKTETREKVGYYVGFGCSIAGFLMMCLLTVCELCKKNKKASVSRTYQRPVSSNKISNNISQQQMYDDHYQHEMQPRTNISSFT